MIKSLQINRKKDRHYYLIENPKGLGTYARIQKPTDLVQVTANPYDTCNPVLFGAYF